MRVAATKGTKTEALEDGEDACFPVGRRCTPEAQPVPDVRGDGHVGPQRIGLEDEPKVPSFGRYVDCGGCVKHDRRTNGDPAGIGTLKTTGDTEQGGFPTAGGAEQGNDFALMECDRYALQDCRTAE